MSSLVSDGASSTEMPRIGGQPWHPKNPGTSTTPPSPDPYRELAKLIDDLVRSPPSYENNDQILYTLALFLTKHRIQGLEALSGQLFRANDRNKGILSEMVSCLGVLPAASVVPSCKDLLARTLLSAPEMVIRDGALLGLQSLAPVGLKKFLMLAAVKEQHPVLRDDIREALADLSESSENDASPAQDKK